MIYLDLDDLLHVAARTFSLRPGESLTLEYDITLRTGFSEDVRVRATPGPAVGQFAAQTLRCS